jgi:hypothetical protein
MICVEHKGRARFKVFLIDIEIRFGMAHRMNGYLHAKGAIPKTPRCPSADQRHPAQAQRPPITSACRICCQSHQAGQVQSAISF